MKSLFYLYPYQARYLEDDTPFKIALFARQCGKSYVAGLELVLETLVSLQMGRKTRWLVLSLSQRHTQTFMKEHVIPKFITFFKVLAHHEHQDSLFWREVYQRMSITQNRIGFGDQVSIDLLPATPDCARGFSGHVLLDEFAFVRHDDLVWKSIFPVISSGFKIRILSTPNGKNNVFYRLSQNKKWNVHWCNIHQAMKEGLSLDLKGLKEALCDEHAFQREYELSFDSSDNKAFRSDLVEQAMKLRTPESKSDNLCYVGVDVARWSDFFVIWVLESVGGFLKTKEVVAKKAISFQEQEKLLLEVLKRHRVHKVLMDQTGMGEKPVEDAKRQFGSKIEGIRLNALLKRKLVLQTKNLLEVGHISLWDDPKVLIAFDDILERPSAKWGSLYQSRRNQHGHADLAWACMFAVHIALTHSKPPKSNHYERVHSDGFILSLKGNIYER